MTTQADRDQLAVAVEDAIIDHCGTGGTAALTDRIVALTDAATREGLGELRSALARYDGAKAENWLAHSQNDPERDAVIAAARLLAGEA